MPMLNFQIKKRNFMFIVISVFISCCFLFQFIFYNKKWSQCSNDISCGKDPFLEQESDLHDRLLLIDKNLLEQYKSISFDRKPYLKGKKEPCVFCDIKTKQPLTSYAILWPRDTSVKKYVPQPIIQALEFGFWVICIISTEQREFSPYETNLPLGYILLKGEEPIIEIVLLHERKGNFWWHGSFDQDLNYKSKLDRLNLLNKKDKFVLNQEGAFDKFQVKSVVIDDYEINMPSNVTRFLKESSKFIECDYEQANKFYKTYRKEYRFQKSFKALAFTRGARKILLTAKEVLDDLQIPFWISSGTLLGYFRQCDIIRYTTDVDIGIFIDNYNEKLINGMRNRKMTLLKKFGLLKEGLEFSFMQNNVRLDIFFFYDGGDHYWFATIQKNSTDTAIKYREKVRKFTLCWTEFLELKIRIPCETKDYIEASYGPDWFQPIKHWDYNKSPPNAEVAGIWTKEDMKTVYQIFH